MKASQTPSKYLQDVLAVTLRHFCDSLAELLAQPSRVPYDCWTPWVDSVLAWRYLVSVLLLDNLVTEVLLN